jgi:hypothetical protein
MRRKTMARFNATSKDAAKRARAIAIELNQGAEQQSFHIRKTMILLAIAMLGTAVASHAFAAGRMGGGLGLGGGFQGGHMSDRFTPPILDETPTTPAPAFNPSEPYTVLQSPETAVSPGSPGSVFGNE